MVAPQGDRAVGEAGPGVHPPVFGRGGEPGNGEAVEGDGHIHDDVDAVRQGGAAGSTRFETGRKDQANLTVGGKTDLRD